MRFQPGNEFIKVLCRGRFTCEKGNPKRDQRRDWREVIHYVVWKRMQNAVQHMRGCDTRSNRVAIGLRAGNPAGADAPIRTADVFDNDGLAEGLFHPLGNEPRDYIERAARLVRDNHRNRTRRIARGRRGAGECRSDCSGPGELQECSARKFHGVSPNDVRLKGVPVILNQLFGVMAGLVPAIGSSRAVLRAFVAAMDDLEGWISGWPSAMDGS